VKTADGCRLQRAVSEIVAILLVSLIVISVGGVLLLKLRDFQAIWSEAISGLQNRASQLSSEPAFSIVYSYIDISKGYVNVMIFINIAPGSLIISSIYLNSVRINENFANITVDGKNATLSSNGELILNGGDAHVVEVIVPASVLQGLSSSNSTYAIVKIVSKSGISETASATVLTKNQP